MRFGKTITMFLIEGEPSGRATCELSNWTGLGYRLPRHTIKDCDDRDDLKGPAVYMLFGLDDEGKKAAYIGESEEALTRLRTHIKEKDFWTEALVFVSKDNNLNKAHIKYLESRMIELATYRRRYKLTQNTTKAPRINEAERSTMEEFLSNIIFFVDVLGHRIFEEDAIPQSKSGEKVIFTTKNKARGAASKGHPTNDGFQVLAGSKAATQETPSIPKGWKRLREELIEKGILLWNENRTELTFVESYEFSSPTAAAGVCMGASVNGLDEWVLVSSGTKLKDYEAGKE
jgi:hypothetical protein